MPSSLTKIQVWNLAIDMVKDHPLQTVTDATPEARWLSRNYDHTVEMALRANLWSFAIETHQLNADAGFTATPNWIYRYDIPNAAIRLVPPTLGGKRGNPPIPYEFKGNKVFANYGPALYVDFVMNEPNVGRWDALFVQVVAASLAEGMAHRFTHKASYLQLAIDKKNEALEIADQTNAFEAGMEQPEVYDIIRAREL